MPTLIWHVDDDIEFCGLAAEVAERVGLSVVRLAPEEAAQRHGAALPNAVIVDGEPFRTSSAPGGVRAAEPPRYIEHADRVLVCTAYLDEDLDVQRLDDERIRVLRKPFDLDEFELALAWLGDEHGDARHLAAVTPSETPQFAVLGARAGRKISAAEAG